MRLTRFSGVCGLVAVLASASPAAADVTGFLGLSPTGETRLARGAAVGFGLIAVGFELEVANLSEQLEDGVPGLTTGMINGLVQTPGAISRVQAYGTAGGGIYRERLGEESETSVGVNVGGGIKYRLSGPLRLRVDYRVFRLSGSPLHDTYHRFYGGLTLAF